MRLSAYPIQTLKEVPADAEVISHQLMLRAGLIRRLAGGLYTWLPFGLRVLRKVERIIREEMDRAGALELSMPVAQPGDLWVESGRWDQFGPELLRFKDRNGRDMVLGPTHEEVITDLARRELKSYRQLPVNFYQIQTKFRDEIRPRFGVMRAREFLMKDAYSFHADAASLEDGYQRMYAAYTAIFTRMQLEFRAVLADTGAIGGSASQEFHVLASSGEDAIAFSDADDYAANLEMAAALPPAEPRPAPSQPMAKVSTPGARTIAEVSACLALPAQRLVKTLMVEGDDGGLVALVVRGDHDLNALKAQKLPGVARPLRMAGAEQIQAAAGCEPGFLGPVGLRCRSYADHAALQLADFACGANERDAHLTGVNWGRDLPEPEAADLRNAVEGDPSPSGRGRLRIARGIEVGHIFQLGCKYSEALGATVLDEQGNEREHGDGLLWNRRHPGRGGGDRTEPRRPRDHLARAARAVHGRAGAAQLGEVAARSRGGGVALPRADRRRHRSAARRSRCPPGRQVRRRGTDRRPAPGGGRRARTRRRPAGVPPPARERERGPATGRRGSRHPRAAGDLLRACG